jgi:signal transduction histidine kinase
MDPTNRPTFSTPHSVLPGTHRGELMEGSPFTVRSAGDRRATGHSGMLIAAQEEERSRIARELHDDINQQLALIAIEAQSIELAEIAASPLAKRMHHLWEGVVRVSRDVEHVSHELHSFKLQHLGLASALGGLCREFEDKQRIVVKLDVAGAMPKLSEEIALSLFRVAQESLRNVAKHSGAHTVSVRLSAGQINVSLRIADDGVGFRAHAAVGSIGLGTTSMRERMQLVGGKLVITSRVFLGTIVEAVVPLAPF